MGDGHDSHASPTSSRGRGRLTAAAVAACLGGGAAVACVDTGPRTQRPDGGGMTMTPPAAMCEAAPPTPYPGTAPIPSEDADTGGPYAWKNVVIKGGGFVSGIIMSPVLPGLAFARTDVGGAYRFDPANHRWMSITDWLGRPDTNLTGIESIAADPVDPNRVYLAAGTYLTAGNGMILSSADMGRTWARHAIPAPMGGNVDGRSMGERLAIDPNLPSTLYFGSRNAGLWRSTDSAVTWTRVATFPTMGATNGGVGTNSNGVAGTGYGLTFVAFEQRSGAPGAATPTIYVGVGELTGTPLYRSTDAGATWAAVPDQPTGMMPHHAVFDGCGNLYLAYNNGSGPNGITAGAVWRLTRVFPAPDGGDGGDAGDGGEGDGGAAVSIDAWANVSPPHIAGGFGGISADAAHPGTLLVSTMDYWSPGEVFRTRDGGASWAPIRPATGQHDVAGARWLFWHGSNLPAAGWMGDVEIDPFNPARALYITGQGIWSSDDVTAADTGASTHWAFDNDGLEETVALDIASPHEGPPLLTGVGDIAGFRHDDLGVSPPDGMFGNPIFGNTTSLDFAGGKPAIVARVGTFSGASQGLRGAHSTDGGATWTGFTAAPMGSTGQGSIAVSADGATFLWSPGGAALPSYSSDKGATWTASTGITQTGSSRLAADRVNPRRFYANRGSRMYVSDDGGATFTQVPSPSGGRPRPVFGVEGDVWYTATNNSNPALVGAFRLQASGTEFTKVGGITDATAIGFGMAAPGQTYPAVYVAGSVGSAWGIYRSDDAGANWVRVDDQEHQFGYINCLTGDPRHYGRVYLGTSGRGIIYGDPRLDPQPTKDR